MRDSAKVLGGMYCATSRNGSSGSGFAMSAGFDFRLQENLVSHCEVRGKRKHVDVFVS
jgi:hypothetical protein